MMTSTEFNVGLGDGRCSSRVLKPPGGGSSNIIFDNKEEQPKQQRRGQSSDIKDCLNFESEVRTKKNESEQKPENIATPEKKSEQPSPAARVRVPPGGFSSGLW